MTNPDSVVLLRKEDREELTVTDYESLILQAEGLTAGVPHPIANMANVSALLFENVEDLNWAGFYLLEGETLVLGPFQGKPACIEIPIQKGVCGAAVREKRSQLVADVHAFPGHIACDCASRSELVVPLFRNGAVFGVLDLDSPTEGRFSEADRIGMERLAAAIEASI